MTAPSPQGGLANGSRECAPDDKLRAIRRSPTIKRRVAPEPVIGPRFARTRWANPALRADTVDVKYRGDVHARLSIVAARRERVSFSAAQLVPTIHGQKERKFGGAALVLTIALGPLRSCLAFVKP